VVISDSQNKISAFKNAGFIAYSLTGEYNVLSIIYQTHLDTVMKDNVTNAVLGSSQEVKTRRHTDFVVALL